MTDHTIFVYDQSEKGLEYATWLLGFHRVGSAGSGLILEEHSERNGLLQAIAERPDPTLALKFLAWLSGVHERMILPICVLRRSKAHWCGSEDRNHDPARYSR